LPLGKRSRVIVLYEQEESPMDKAPAIGTLVAFNFAGEPRTARVLEVLPSPPEVDGDPAPDIERDFLLKLDFAPLGLSRFVRDVEPA
jgi:hypothetical protein